MAYLAVDKDGSEYVYDRKPHRVYGEHAHWDDVDDEHSSSGIYLPQHSIIAMTGTKITWEDEPIKI